MTDHQSPPPLLTFATNEEIVEELARRTRGVVVAWLDQAEVPGHIERHCLRGRGPVTTQSGLAHALVRACDRQVDAILKADGV